MRYDFESLKTENTLFRESITDQMIALDDVGWLRLLGGVVNNGPDLDILRRTSLDLQDMAATNPLHKRGAQLRHDYVFSGGIKYSKVKPGTKKLITDPYNKDALFSTGAFKTANLALFTDGNFFIVRDTRTNGLTVVPMHQITGVVTDVNDPQRINYLKRAWVSNGQDNELWYPIARYAKSKNGGVPRLIPGDSNKTPVSRNAVIYHRHTNRQTGWTFGIPDSLAAKVWSLAYSGYLKDNSKLVKALSQIAWKISTTTKAGNDNAAAKIAIPGVAGAVVAGSGTDINAMPRGGGDVNFNNGQPLAAMVATSFGVPVIALLSSPGATGGSYGAATTLDEPTLKGMTSLQAEWKDFLDEILHDFGSPNADVDFPAISTDFRYREMTSLATAFTTGALFQQEYRDAAVDLLDVPDAQDGLPQPNGFNTWTEPTAPKPAIANPVASQGNTGSVPGGTSQGVTDHSGDTNK